MMCDAGRQNFPSAASLRAAVFDATTIEAAPFLGSLIGDAGFLAINNRGFTPLTFGLASCVGKTVYFAYRSSKNDTYSYNMLLTDLVISC